MRTTRFLTICLSAGVLAMAAGTARATNDRAADEQEQKLIAVLKSDAPKAEKAITCKYLAIHGGKDAVPELAKLLPDEQLTSWARIALEVIPAAEADAALRDALGTVKGRTLIGVVNSVGVRGDAAAVDPLAGLLGGDDPDVAAAAAVALGNIGNPQAAEILEQSLTAKPAAVRSAVAEGLVLCAEKLLASGNGSEAAAMYDTVRNADVPKQRIVEATRGAILARQDAGVPLLVEQLRSDDKVMFRLGLQTARELSGNAIIEALVAELGLAAAERQPLLIQALADRDDKSLLPTMLQAAKSGPKATRIAALGMMPRVGNASCLGVLLVTAVENDADLAKAAKAAVKSLPGKEVDADLVERLAKADGKTRLVLIEAVGERRVAAAVTALLEALKDSDAVVRTAALASLGSTVDADKLPVLISLVVSPKNAADAPTAQKALRAACVRMPDREACAAQLVSALAQAPVEVKCVILDILGAMQGKTALAAVDAAAKSADIQQQDAATRLLGRWMSADAAPVLLDLAKNLPDGKFKVRAMRGYIRVFRQLKLPPQQVLEMCSSAMQVARRDDERKLILDTLTRYPSPASLALATGSLGSDTLRDTAATVSIAIAGKIVDKKPKEAAQAMQQVIGSGVKGDLLEQAKAMAARAGK